jgi:hypothetical protein
MGDDRLTFTIDDLFRAYERARLLERMLDEDPSDIEAMRAYAELVAAGLDVADPALVHGFTPDDARGVDCEPEAVPATSLADEWTDKMIEEAAGYASAGLVDHAIDLLEAVLHIRPAHDVARARLFALEAKRNAPPRPDPDATVRMAALSADATLRIVLR